MACSSIDVSWIRESFNGHKNGYARIYRILGTDGFMSAKELQKLHNVRYCDFKDELTVRQVAKMLGSLSKFNDGKYVEVVKTPNLKLRTRPFRFYRRRTEKETTEWNKKRNSA